MTILVERRGNYTGTAQYVMRVLLEFYGGRLYPIGGKDWMLFWDWFDQR